VGNRVESVKALEQLLKEDPVFKDYAVIVAAGDGRTFEEEENDFKGNESSFQKVKKAIAENDKTITLSCGQLTTGVTVKEWTAVLMLTDIKTPAIYMQAAFRAQNPYKEWINGELHVKNSAYLFDFAPTRVLEIYDHFANGLNPKAVQGEITEKERETNIKELLNFFPVISEDVNGEMIELDAQQVLTFPNALAAAEIVNARFMTNLLFNDTLKGVFNFPKEVEKILDKLPEENNKRVQKSKNRLDLDDAKEINDNKTAKINENTGIILGEKIYRSNTERVIDDLLAQNNQKIATDELVEKVSEVAAPLIAKYKDVYKATQAETKEATDQLQEKVKQIAEEYNNAEIKNSDELKLQLMNAIEDDLVKSKVEQKETEAVEKVQKTKEEEIRDRLRSFTRTIPMFVMANDSKEEITIDNFDLEIDAADFEDLTSITKEEFHKLRDGFDYEENSELKTFQGVFNKYRFNASIAEFRQRKQELANYFTAEEDIFELIPNQKTNQIFTPKKVVKMMVDQLEAHDPSLFTRTDSTFVDLYMKSGMYITEIVKKLFHNTRKHYTSDEECLQHILENQVYGLAPTPILQGITQSYIFGFDTEHQISRTHFVQYDLTPEAEQGNPQQKLQELFNLKEDMKFDAVVGNPPYQESGEARDEPVYHYFYDSAKKLSDQYILISPGRFLFNAGQTPKSWNQKMLSDKHLKIVFYEQDSSKLFQNTDIKGGVAIVYRNRNLTFENIGTFVHLPELKNIAKKVENKTQLPFADLVQPQGIYRFSSAFFIEFPNAEKMQGKGTKNKIVSKSFSEMDFAFLESKVNQDFVKILGLVKAERQYKWIDKKHLSLPDSFEKWKVFIPEANGSGAIGEVLSTPLIGEPLIGHTDTFLSIGAFDNELEAENCLKYIKSKFARTMLGVLKITQHNSRATWAKVPVQDFTSTSDIDWSTSISAIDQQLYAKYKLSAEEIEFIERMIKPMSEQ
jgi:hypothetical protein